MAGKIDVTLGVCWVAGNGALVSMGSQGMKGAGWN